MSVFLRCHLHQSRLVGVVGYGIDNLQPATQASESYAQYNDNIFFGEGNFSFEEMNDIMRKFTEDDPDGNGIDDTYGMLYMPPNVNESWVNQTQYAFRIC